MHFGGFMHKQHKGWVIKGASSWLSVLPVEEHGFALHKSAFRYAICLRYVWFLSGLPAHCVCGQGFSVNHVMNCPIEGILLFGTMICATLLLRLCLRFALTDV